jgi:hypothetical protein
MLSRKSRDDKRFEAMTIKQSAVLSAAQQALDKGWHIFAAPPRTKKTYAGTHGSLDAVNTTAALTRWKTDPESNPCIRLDFSGLVVLDADHGLHSLEEAVAWAEKNGIPQTYIVSTGRDGGGFHFYFFGTRTLPDITRTRKKGIGRVGFELDGVSGDIKHHGHVVAEGGIHKTGAIYIGNGTPVAALPDFIRDYQDPLVKQKREQWEATAKKRTEGQIDSTRITLIPVGGRHGFLLKEAAHLHWRGMGEQSSFLGLRDICNRYCIDGSNYPDSKIRELAAYFAAKSYDRQIKISISRIPAPQPTLRALIAGLLQNEFEFGCLVSIQTIVTRIGTRYPTAPKATVLRALKLAGFKTFGRDPGNGKSVLWTRHGTKKGEVEHPPTNKD